MKIQEIPKDAVKIPNSLDYVDKLGNIYTYDTRKYHPRSAILKEQQTVYGYKYCGIKYIDANGHIRNITKRVHRLVAEAFVPNPDPSNFDVVMHIDNNKSNNRWDNLQWGTISQNTLAAVRDGLLRNDKGIDDSQSQPCDCYDTLTNRLIGVYGSKREAALQTGVTLGTICQQCSSDAISLKKPLYFTNRGEGPRAHTVIVARDYDTDAEVGRYVNCEHASKHTGIPSGTIAWQTRLLSSKPKYKAHQIYFSKVLLEK